MLNKKIILPFAALAMASFVACGDDSSSSPSNGTPSTTPSTTDLPASVQTLEDAINLTCSQTVNMCVKVYVEEDKDTVQCNGTLFTPMTFGKPVEGCEKGATSTPATDEPATENPGAGEEPAGPGAGEDPADPSAGEEPAGPGAGEEPAGPGAGEEPAGPGAGEEPAGPGAGEEPAGPGAGEEPAGPGAGEEPAGPGAGEEPAGPGAGEEPAGPGAGEQPAAGGDVIYCIVPGVMGGCEELPAAMKDMCETTLEGQLVDACPAE